MARKEITTEVNADAFDLGAAVATFVGKVQLALKDGWQPGQDLPPILSAALTDLAPQVSKFDDVQEAFKTDPVYAAKGITIAASAIAEKLLVDATTNTTPVV